MTAIIWAVPAEAVRSGLTRDAAVTMAKLAADRAVVQPTATVELGRAGFVATLTYVLPGTPARKHAVHLTLDWAPQENAR